MNFIPPSTLDSTEPSPNGTNGLTSTTRSNLAVAHSRSCTFCRHRKVKCDRQQPCSNCVRASHGLDCTYPPGPGRAAKRSRQALDSQVVDRLSRLETMIRRLGTETPLSSSLTESIDERLPAAENASLIASSSSEHSGSADHQQLGRLVIDETRSYYISNILWASLGNEVSDLKFELRCMY